MNVTWLPGAADDLEQIIAERTEYSEAAAARRADNILERSEQIAAFPRSGRMIGEFGVETLREVIVGGYRMMYELFPDRVEVFAIARSRRDLFGPR